MGLLQLHERVRGRPDERRPVPRHGDPVGGRGAPARQRRLRLGRPRRPRPERPVGGVQRRPRAQGGQRTLQRPGLLPAGAVRARRRVLERPRAVLLPDPPGYRRGVGPDGGRPRGALRRRRPGRHARPPRERAGGHPGGERGRELGALGLRRDGPRGRRRPLPAPAGARLSGQAVGQPGHAGHPGRPHPAEPARPVRWPARRAGLRGPDRPAQPGLHPAGPHPPRAVRRGGRPLLRLLPLRAGLRGRRRAVGERARCSSSATSGLSSASSGRGR